MINFEEVGLIIKYWKWIIVKLYYKNIDYNLVCFLGGWFLKKVCCFYFFRSLNGGVFVRLKNYYEILI